MATDRRRLQIPIYSLRSSAGAGRLEELDLLDVILVRAEVDAHAGTGLLGEDGIPGHAGASHQLRGGIERAASDAGVVTIGTHPLLLVREDFAGAVGAGELADLTLLVEASG